MKKATKVTAVIVIAILLCSMLYSIFFITNNARHDCTGESCPVCEQLQIAGSIVNKVSTAITTIVAAIFLCVSTQICGNMYQRSIVENSPIRLKVKMLN